MDDKVEERQKLEQKQRNEPRASNDNRARDPAPEKVATVAVEPGRVDRFREAHPSKKVVLGLMVVAAALTMFIGFNWGGWTTASAAQTTAAKGARDAIVLRLAPICVAQFNLDPQKASKLVEFKAITNSYDRPKYVKEQGWATMPGDTTPDNAVADACAKLLIAS